MKQVGGKKPVRILCSRVALIKWFFGMLWGGFFLSIIRSPKLLVNQIKVTIGS